MILFPLYAVFIWALAVHWRRRWQGLAAVVLGTSALGAVCKLISGPSEELSAQTLQLQMLIWADAAIILPVGLYIVCLPRPISETECRGCRYDLSRLDPVGLSCPECGARWRGKGSEFEPKPPPLVPIPTGPPKRRTIL